MGSGKLRSRCRTMAVMRRRGPGKEDWPTGAGDLQVQPLLPSASARVYSCFWLNLHIVLWHRKVFFLFESRVACVGSPCPSSRKADCRSCTEDGRFLSGWFQSCNVGHRWHFGARSCGMLLQLFCLVAEYGWIRLTVVHLDVVRVWRKSQCS